MAQKGETKVTVKGTNDQGEKNVVKKGDNVSLNLSELEREKPRISHSHVTPDNLSIKLQLPKKTNLSDFFQTAEGIS